MHAGNCRCGLYRKAFARAKENTLLEKACFSRVKGFATPMFYFLLAYYFLSLLVFLWQKIREADYEDQFKPLPNP
jgi:hypothetical protein